MDKQQQQPQPLLLVPHAVLNAYEERLGKPVRLQSGTWTLCLRMAMSTYLEEWLARTRLHRLFALALRPSADEAPPAQPRAHEILRAAAKAADDDDTSAFTADGFGEVVFYNLPAAIEAPLMATLKGRCSNAVLLLFLMYAIGHVSPDVERNMTDVFGIELVGALRPLLPLDMHVRMHLAGDFAADPSGLASHVIVTW